MKTDKEENENYGIDIINENVFFVKGKVHCLAQSLTEKN